MSNDWPAKTDGRRDLYGAIGWMVLGVAILVGSLAMDRLEDQDVSLYTAPGLLPGLLGIAITLLGTLLAARSWRSGAWRAQVAREDSAGGAGERRHLPLVIGLCLAFDILLVGHGLPFWLAAAIFVTTSILLLGHRQPRAAVALTAREVLAAGAIGLGAGIAITLVFQGIFLVRLP
jgi:Tripartite tricarboxylate transporter TctB family